nr:nonstructural polyprotein [Hepelivirales sp.]
MEIDLHYSSRPTTSEAYDSAVSRVTVENLNNAIGSAFICRYALTKAQHSLFARIMNPQVVDYAKKLSSHNHPIPAMLQSIAYSECHKFSKNFKRSIDVGGTPLRTPPDHHLCTLINDSRTHSRYLNACTLNQNLDFSHGLFNKTRRVCTYGAENCTYQAPYAYAINVYDIPIETIPLIMSIHNIQIFDLWMFFPNRLIDRRLTDDEDIYKTQIMKTNNKQTLSFTFSDGSTSYIHDYTNWQKYLKTTRIDTPTGSIFIEFVGRSYHTFRCLRFTKTDFSSINYERHIKPYGGGPYYEVPDVVRYFYDGDAMVDMWLFSDLVEARIVEDAFAYTNRQADASLNYSNFCAFLDSKSSALYYQANGEQKLVLKKLDLSATEYISLSISLYVIGMIDRIKRTKRIGEIISSLKDKGAFHEFKRMIKQFFRDVNDNLSIKINNHSDRREIYDLKAIDYTRIENLTVRKYEFKPFNGLIRLGVDKTFNYNVKNSISYVNNRRMIDLVKKDDSTDEDTEDEKVDTLKISKGKRPHKLGNIKAIAKDEELQSDNIKRVGKDEEEVHQYELPPNKHYKVTYNPSGSGGRCGLYCINHFLNVNPLTVYEHAKTSFLTTEDIFSIAYQCKFNVIIHTDASTEVYYIGSHLTLRMANLGMHWVVVDCDCLPYEHYVGEYKNLPLSKTHLYVNCANQQFTDGAGQAASFRQLFNGYQNNIPKPNDYSQSIMFNGYHLFLAVANNQRANNNRQLSFIRYARIFSEINTYATDNDLCVYLPMLGTVIYGCDICCFKYFVTRLTCKYVLTFYSAHERDLYDKTRPCVHAQDIVSNLGGAVDFGIFASMDTKITKYDDETYNKIMPRFGRAKMSLKAQDLFDMIPKEDVVIEVSAAPGHFYKYAVENKIPYIPLHFTGKCAFAIFHEMKPHATWHTHKELEEIIDNICKADPFKDYHLLLDCPIESSHGTHKALLDIAKKWDMRYTTKFMAYQNAEFDVSEDFEELNGIVNDPRFLQRIWHNEASSELSSEMFITYSLKKDDNKINAVADINAIVQEVDAHNLDKQDKLECKCDHDKALSEFINAKLTWKHSDSGYATLCTTLSKDKLNKDVDFDPIKTAKPITEIDAIIGVAGSAKSRGMLKAVCPVCTIIIAPFRSVAQQHKAINNTAVTYVKAIAHAKRTSKTRLVVLDEFYAMCPMMATLYQSIFNCRMIAMGDPCQLRNIDLDNIDPEINTMCKSYRLISFRFNKAVAEALKNYIPGIQSNKDGVINAATTIKKKQGQIIITHTQARKKKWMDDLKTSNVRTVAEAMGSTFKDIVVDTTDITDIINNKGRYVYTGITRASDNVTLYGNKDQIMHYISFVKTQSPDYPIRTDITNKDKNIDIADVKLGKSAKLNVQTHIPEKDVETEVLFTGKTVSRTEGDFSHLATKGEKLLVKERGSDIVVSDNNMGVKPLVKISNGKNDDLVEEINILGSRVEDAMTAFDVTPFSDNVHRSEVERVVQSEHLRSLTREQFDISAVQDILDKVYIPSNDMCADNVIGYKDNLIKEVKSERNITIPIDAADRRDEELIGVRMSENRTYNRTYLGKDNKMLLDTIIHRYMNNANSLPSEAAKVYYDGLCKFMNKDFRKCRVQTAEDCWASVRCYLENLQKKLGTEMVNRIKTRRLLIDKWKIFNEKHPGYNVSVNDDERYFIPDTNIEEKIDDPELAFAYSTLNSTDHSSYLRRLVGEIYKSMKSADADLMTRCYTDFETFAMQVITGSDLLDDQTLKSFNQLNDDWYSNRSKVIDFHCKNQPKEVRGLSFDIKDKVGQGISAWSKILNVIMSTFCKGFESDFKNHLSDKILLAIDESDKDLSVEFAKRGHLYVDNKYRRLDCDITEFDSSQNAKTVAMHCLILSQQGFNSKAIGFMANMRSDYRCNALINSKLVQRIKFDVSYVMTSGALFTLSGNTIVNMAIIGASFDFTNLQFGAFKGDDSHVVAGGIKTIKHGNMLTSTYLGHKLKAEMNFFSEFIANFITPIGFFPDVIRRASRVISKVYTHPDDWNKIRISVADSLMVITNDNQLSIGCEFASAYYQERHIDVTPDEVYTLVSFLHRVTYDDDLRPTKATKFKIKQLNLDYDSLL